MVAGVGRLGLFAAMAAANAVAMQAHMPELTVDIEPVVDPRRRHYYPLRDHNAHVWDWEYHQRREKARLEREARIAAQQERDRPMIDAAEAKRARKAAKRLAQR